MKEKKLQRGGGTTKNRGMGWQLFQGSLKFEEEYDSIHFGVD